MDKGSGMDCRGREEETASGQRTWGNGFWSKEKGEESPPG